MRERLRAFLNRPIETAEQRRWAMALSAVVVVGAAVAFLALGGSDGDGDRDRQRPANRGGGAPVRPTDPPPQPIVGPTEAPIGDRPPAEVERAGRAFFESYLAVYYGRGKVIREASPRLTRELAGSEPNTALRGRRARIETILADRDEGGAYRVAARVDDGGPQGPFPLFARFERRDGVWQAVDLTRAE